LSGALLALNAFYCFEKNKRSNKQLCFFRAFRPIFQTRQFLLVHGGEKLFLPPIAGYPSYATAFTGILSVISFSKRKDNKNTVSTQFHDWILTIVGF